MYCHFQVTDSTITLLRMFIGVGLGKGCNLCEREKKAREAEGTGRWWDVLLATVSGQGDVVGASARSRALAAGTPISTTPSAPIKKRKRMC